jgi:hypothetical protein
MRLLTTAFFLFAALASAEDAEPAEARRLKPDHAPTPFSAARIREGCPSGRVSTFLIEQGGHKVLQVFRFVKADAEGAEFSVDITTEDGKPLKKSQPTRQTWSGFQAHASFPANVTRITEGRVKTPAGTFDCWVYIVIAKGKTVTKESRFYFAKTIPGPPVKMTQQMDGKTVFSMTLVRHRDGQEKHVLSAMGAYAEEFEKLDAEARGKTTKPGYVKSRAIAEEAKAIFKRIDKNGDGKLSPDEFLAGSKITDPKKATLAFHRFDRDADGAITLEEFGNTCLEWALGG